MLNEVRRGARDTREGVASVRRLQAELRARGFSPGRIDGRFGPATEAALIAFQRSEDLLVDGIAGRRTWAVLAADTGCAARADVLEHIDADLVGAMFPFTRAGAIRRNLPAIVAGLEAEGLDDAPMVLVALATVRAETEGFEPIEERPSRYNTSPGGHPFDLYDLRKDLGNRGRPDGKHYKGRGFIQLTGRANYERIGARLGLEGLEATPDAACDAALAGRVLAAFLAANERRLKEALLCNDLAGARRVVNGGRHGLARFKDAYRIGARLLRTRTGSRSLWSAKPCD